MGGEKGAMAARFVGAAAEQRHSTGGAASPHLRDRRLRLGSLEAGEITRDVLRPGDFFVEVGAQQLGHRPELLEPDVDTLLADAARPEAHDQYAVAVIRRRGVVDALGGDVHAACRAQRRSSSASTSGSSGFVAWSSKPAASARSTSS